MTYAHGCDVAITRPITKGDIRCLCNALNSVLVDCVARPEAISEGGIRFVYDNPRFYKSIRIHGWNWPWVHEDWYNSWYNSNELICDGIHGINGTKKMYTFLKAFKNAPVWTRDELLLIYDMLEVYCGLRRLGKLPTRRALSDTSHGC